MSFDTRRTLRGALAGALATGVWALQQPLDKRAFGSCYDDVELLGRFVTGTRDGWFAPGLALHVGNGALFGAVYAQLAPLLPGPPAARGTFVALAEHVALWPAGRLSDRHHPGRDELPVLTGSRRAFWQAAWRHALFGVLLGELESRLNPQPLPPVEPDPDPLEHHVSSNGHGDIARAAGVARVDSGIPPE
ncbi:hypothetical protein [Conexibacter sp. CPCC 206217]|uniref:hypothetical protein n=1 Tax=Conexibacter sp. CPCC 206217 TaxID=3064574 RepID=UPI002715DB7B|nr:hypothetical protein [Conexibacter sp. CPCC 206217]MDO8209270.1 hypothetical protein [Conexibacter sp. CPCC 206217]